MLLGFLVFCVKIVLLVKVCLEKGSIFFNNNVCVVFVFFKILIGWVLLELWSEINFLDKKGL